MADATGPEQLKIPLKTRMKAWWNGHEIVVRQPDEAAVADADKDSTNTPFETVWPPERIELAQAVWGKGFCGPGSGEIVIPLVKPIGLNPAMSLLYLGADLGGGVRAVADHFGVWVAGYEADAQLAEAGALLCAKSELAKKVTVELFDLAAFEASDKKFDAIFCRDFGFVCADKKALLSAVVAHVKPGGHLVISDYVEPEENPKSAELEDWVANEPVTPHLWPMARYSEVLVEQGMEVRIAEDITAKLRTEISDAWSAYLAQMDPAATDGAAPQALAFEVKHWMTRAKLLECGALQACRFHCMKRQSGELVEPEPAD